MQKGVKFDLNQTVLRTSLSERAPCHRSGNPHVIRGPLGCAKMRKQDYRGVRPRIGAIYASG